MDNPWSCDCHLKAFRQFVIQRNLSPSPILCYEPERLSDKTWAEVESYDFACKPSVIISDRHLVVPVGENVTLSCLVGGSPVPAVRWVLGGRIIANMSSPLHSSSSRQNNLITEVQGRGGGKEGEKTSSLTIKNINKDDLGSYSCVAINQGGMAENNASLILQDNDLLLQMTQEVFIILAFTGASVVFVASLIIFCVYLLR